MMDNKRLEATYLVNESCLLHLKETETGFEYQCFEKNGAEVGSGLVLRCRMEESAIRSPLACACTFAVSDIGLDVEKIAVVSRDMLSQFPRGRKLLYQLEKDGMANDSRSIRFIDSHYNEKFRIPDGGVLQVIYPHREYSMKCSYIDDYHMRAGYAVCHICQFAEMIERGNGICQPEPVVLDEEAAWKVNDKGYVSVQTRDDGYGYTVCDEDFHKNGSGKIDARERTINEIRDKILAELGWDKRRMVRMDYKDLQDHGLEVEGEQLAGEKSALGQLFGLKSISSGEPHAPKRRESER